MIVPDEILIEHMKKKTADLVLSGLNFLVWNPSCEQKVLRCCKLKI